MNQGWEENVARGWGPDFEDNEPRLPPSLAGKVAIVTGASRGIGAAIALELGGRKASVAVNYVKESDDADAIVRQIINKGGAAVAIQADVSKVPEITRLFEETVEAYGKINIVCSVAGMESFDKIEDVTEERFDLVFGLNLRAQFFVGQHAYTYCEYGGRLILTSAVAAGTIGIYEHALFAGSKSGVHGITKAFANDFGEKRITVNAIAPGRVQSEVFSEFAWRYVPGGSSQLSKGAIVGHMEDACPLYRCGRPVDIARVVAFLASDDSEWVNGQIITLSGGSEM